MKSHLYHLFGEKTCEVSKASVHYKVQDFFPQDDLHLWKDFEVGCFMNEHVT